MSKKLFSAKNWIRWRYLYKSVCWIPKLCFSTNFIQSNYLSKLGWRPLRSPVSGHLHYLISFVNYLYSFVKQTLSSTPPPTWRTFESLSWSSMPGMIRLYRLNLVKNFSIRAKMFATSNLSTLRKILAWGTITFASTWISRAIFRLLLKKPLQRSNS